jgi:hypothetical protein
LGPKRNGGGGKKAAAAGSDHICIIDQALTNISGNVPPAGPPSDRIYWI